MKIQKIRRQTSTPPNQPSPRKKNERKCPQNNCAPFALRIEFQTNNPQENGEEKLSLKSLQPPKNNKIPLLAKKIEENLKKGLDPSLELAILASPNSLVVVSCWGARQIEQFVTESLGGSFETLVVAANKRGFSHLTAELLGRDPVLVKPGWKRRP